MTKVKLIFLILLIGFGTFLSSFTMWRSGSNFDFGLGFWGPNGHDAIWHLSVIEQTKKHLPPLNPVFSGTRLENYHWGFDYFASLVSSFFHLDASLVYFKILPITFSLFLGILSFYLIYTLTRSYFAGVIFVFLNYFAGSLGWIVTLIKDRQLGGESLFWSMQSISAQINPPYALSLIILLLGLIMFIRPRLTVKMAILIGFIWGLLFAIKIYAGILIVLSLSLFLLLNFLKTKKIFKPHLFVYLSLGITSISLCLLLGLFRSQSLLIFQPFWFVHTLIESPDKLFIPKLATLRYNLSFQLLSYKLPFILILEFSLWLIFIIGNFGFRLFGLKQLSDTKTNPVYQIFYFIIAFSIIIPTLFVQKGTAWNTIQFMYYGLFMANFFFAIFLSKIKQIPFVIFILILTSITTLPTLKDYFGYPPPSGLLKNEIASLKFLKQQPDGIVLTYPYDKYIKNNLKTPIPLYAYETTAYISAFSGKISYLADEMNLEITGYDYLSRRHQAETFFTSQHVFEAQGFLKNNNIRYVYLINGQKLPFSPKDLQLVPIYDQDQVQIFQSE